MPPKFYKRKYPNTKPKAPSEDTLARSLNATYLIIVESPSKCKKIEEYLGSDYQCIASKGHIRDIEGLKSIDTKRTFEPTFTNIKEKTGHIENMRRIVANFQKENVILATDDDREGEAIAWHICQIFGLPVETTKRILFREITKPAIQEAVSSPTIVNMPLVNAQKARQVLDMVVGFKISPYLWKCVNGDAAKTLSAGRCQTPALRLVFDNDQEKKTSKMITLYKIRASFTSKGIIFDLNHEFDTADQVLFFLKKTKTHKHFIEVGAAHDSKRSSPKPFNTARLLQAAGNVLHMSPREAMNHCQQLYQAGHITYMRTESSQYSPIFLEKAKKYIINRWQSADYLGNFDALVNRDITKPHEAIRVTNLEMSAVGGEDGRAASIYKLIWRNTVESCMADAKYRNTIIKIAAAENHVFSHTVEVPIFLGWKGGATDGTIPEADKANGLLLYLKSLEQAAKPVEYNYVDSEMTARNKHSYYTEASLIQKLEELGIGRPSTFSSIVETIQDRGYVKKRDIAGSIVTAKEYRLASDGAIKETVKERTFGAEKAKLCIEPIGVVALNFLLKYFEGFFSYEYTKHMEDELDAVVLGKDWAEICRGCYAEIKSASKPVNEVLKVKYPLGEGHVLVFGKCGPVIQEIRAATETAATEEEETKTIYISVKKDVDLDMTRLRAGGYTFEDLAEIKNSCLGEFEGEKVFLRSGRYGNYIEYGDVKKSIRGLKKPLDEIVWEDIEPFLGEDDEGSGSKKGVLRTLNSTMSLRNGKFGSYVYYKTATMTKPKFLNIKKFPEAAMICSPEILVEWVCKTYDIKL